MNMMLKLALVVLNSWSVNSAEIAGIMLANPELPQKKIGRQLGIAQSSVSERIQRGSLQEILALESYYRRRIKRLIIKT
jgi:predicted transcriptional regulator